MASQASQANTQRIAVSGKSAVAARASRAVNAARLNADCRSLVSFLESGNGNSPLRIDRENGIIYGVKVLGTISPNTPYQNGRPMDGVTSGTRYTRAAFESAPRVMEGAKVRLNHPDRSQPNADRPVEVGLGVLRNVRATPDGVRADLHYNRAHPFAPQLVEDVERRMGQWGFSPNAAGVGTVQGGVYVVEQLAAIRSIDLVSDPATTVNLWESTHPKKSGAATMGTANFITFRSLMESVLPMLRGKQLRAAVDCLEMDYMQPGMMGEKKEGADIAEEEPMPGGLGDTPVEMPAEGGDPMEAISAGFATALKALVDGVMSGDMPADEAINKFKELIKTHDKLKSGESSTPAPEVAATEEGESEEAKDKEDEKTKADAKESKSSAAIRRELDELKAEKAIALLCESLNYKPTTRQIRAAIALPEAERKPFFAELVANDRRPFSGSPHRAAQLGGNAPANLTESADVREKLYRDAMARLGRPVEVS